MIRIILNFPSKCYYRIIIIGLLLSLLLDISAFALLAARQPSMIIIGIAALAESIAITAVSITSSIISDSYHKSMKRRKHTTNDSL